MNAFFIASTAIALLLSAAACLFAARAAALVQDLRDRQSNFDASLKALHEQSPELLTARVDELEDVTSKLANSLKMSRVRAAAIGQERDKRPDPYTEPDRWRENVNRQLARDKFGLGK